MMRKGTIVDARLVVALPSTNNKNGKSDPEMHQSKNGNDWHFAMKVHVGVDVALDLVHTVIGTAAMSPMCGRRTRCCTATRVPRSATPATRGGKRPENIGKSVTCHMAVPNARRCSKINWGD